MPTLTIISRDGAEKTVEGQIDRSVMENIRDAGCGDLLALCGGCCSCATCHVHVDPAWFELTGPPGADEAGLLESSEHKTATSRLACQIKFSDALDGLRVTIARED
jgi:2Fe-2S ferredoxin